MVEKIQNYLLGTVTFVTFQKFLADVDRNGEIDINDVTRLQRILNGILIY